MFKWIIVGGGIQGTTLATFLLKTGKVNINELAIIDKNARPLEKWKKRADIISMPYLRSPVVHHIDVKPDSLKSYVKRNKNDWPTALYGYYKRPSLDAFNEHCNQLMEEVAIKKAWIQGEALTLEKTDDRWSVSLTNGQKVYGKNLVLALGIGEQLMWPEWARDLKKKNPDKVLHIFDDKVLDFTSIMAPIAIIGGGITAAHLAVKMSNHFPAEVTLIKRHPFRIHTFDSDPAWLGPKNQTGYRKITDYRMRREQIKNARHRGSLPQDLYATLKNRIRKGTIHVADHEVMAIKAEDKRVHLFDDKNNKIGTFGMVILATGFESSLPGKSLIQPIIEKYHLRCAECGYPIVSKNLQWGENLYVTGALAELEMGPIARNISGARQAASLIVNSLC
ncbi:FAD/NAD(P)-binding protein [Peribacillus simplex]|uniref:FAD/NAD(P)-binding protein n=1 Tax=Peribacillus simplex TaxID=1478 RepID=UPI00366CE0E0